MGAFGYVPATWAITEETWKKLNIRGDLTESVWIDCESAETESAEGIFGGANQLPGVTFRFYEIK